MPRRGALILSVCLAAGLSLAAGPATADLKQTGEKALLENCQACHEPLPEGGLSRISHMRKTPEGWDMVVTRMRLWHGVQVSEDEQRAIVAYLSDVQGLAPEETASYRYILERRPDFVEPTDPELGDMCGRCHTLARVALQRRDAEEWNKLAHMHLGQFPTTEYSALGRDRNWWEIASVQLPPLLEKRFPFKTAAWSEWVKAQKKSPEGRWRVVGRQPGVGFFEGMVQVAKDGDQFTARHDLNDQGGSKRRGEGAVILFTGYEWRGGTQFGNVEFQEVFALSLDGNSFAGRFYRAEADEIGGDMNGARLDGPPRILAVSPEYLKAGATGKVSIHGVGLKGDVDFGPGIAVKRVLASSPETVTVEAEAREDAQAGASPVKVGGLSGPSFAVYSALDTVRVDPPHTVARVGGAGGKTPPVTAQFEAVGFLNGPDGKPDTEDDVRIGVFPATWSTENFNEAAERMQDTKFAGKIDPARGLFMPADAGPNPQRPYSTNNAGDLAVVATVRDGEKTLTGKGRLIVTLQRWVDPPIR